jgi:hypothetical protein
MAWKQIREAGNTSFYTQQAEQREWREKSGPVTFLHTGKLGLGKSVLITNIVDDLSFCIEKEEAQVAYFFCKHNDISESLQACTVVGYWRNSYCVLSQTLTYLQRAANTFTPTVSKAR